MGDGALNRLLETEKEAKALIDKAKDRAKKILDEAEIGSEKAREKGLNDFHIKRNAEIEAVKLDSRKEAEKIRRDGIDLAKGLAGKSKTRIPIAVEKVLEMLLEDH